jgi:hypothetical protein
LIGISRMLEEEGFKIEREEGGACHEGVSR